MLKWIVGWLRRVFGLSESPDVLRLPGAPLDAQGRAADLLREQVRRAGLLKPHHRRQIIRDERLLPKPEKTSSWTKPPQVMSLDSATRLFSGTLRTRNRELRTLASDDAQLARLGLPRWHDEHDLAARSG